MVFQALHQVFRNPAYLILSLLAGALAYAAATLLPNIRLIVSVVESSGATLPETLRLIVTLLGSITTNFSVLSAVYTILISVLFGLNVAMFLFFLRCRLGTPSGAGVATGFLGVVAGLLGVGCAACGSFLLSTVLAWIGAGALVTFLPLRGAELGFVAVLLLSVSIYLAARKITDSRTCRT